MKRILTALVLLLLIISCGKDKPHEPEDISLKMSDIPMHQGATWIYQVYDHIDNSYDTAVVTLSDIGHGLERHTLYSFNVEYASGVENAFSWYTFADTLSFGWDNLIGLLPLPFPMYPGMDSPHQNPSDTFAVTYESVEVPKSIYLSAVRVDYGFSANIMDNIFYQIWFVRNTGVVKIEINKFHEAGNSVRQTWELISYYDPMS